MEQQITNICGDNFDGGTDTKFYIERSDREFNKLLPRYEKIKGDTSVSDDEKRRLGSEMGFVCEIYLKSLAPKINNNKEYRALNDKKISDEELCKLLKISSQEIQDIQRRANQNLDLTDDQKALYKIYVKYIGIYNLKHPNNQKPSSVTDFTDELPNIQKQIRFIAFNRRHNLELLINSLEPEVRNVLLSKNINGITVDSNGMATIDSTIADAFDNGKYGVTNYQPDIDGIFNLLGNIKHTIRSQTNARYFAKYLATEDIGDIDFNKVERGIFPKDNSKVYILTERTN